MKDRVTFIEPSFLRLTRGKWSKGAFYKSSDAPTSQCAIPRSPFLSNIFAYIAVLSSLLIVSCTGIRLTERVKNADKRQRERIDHDRLSIVAESSPLGCIR